ncbi:MAG: DNA-processing protein DprA [Bryobacteraceae bacterium]|nr:DNA-processing protein DprA [Bryobacteraceae bacterium]
MLWDARLSPHRVIEDPALLPAEGKTGDKLRVEIAKVSKAYVEECTARAERQLATVKKHRARILTYHDPDYPPNLLESHHPVPILYARGNAQVLRSKKVVACVGSRKIREPYSDLHRQFGKEACANGFVVRLRVRSDLISSSIRLVSGRPMTDFPLTASRWYTSLTCQLLDSA